MWSFTIALPKPGKPSNPDPANGATLSVQPLVLNWANSSNATNYDVYLDGGFVGNVSVSKWTLNQSLVTGSHTWQVVAKNASGNTVGPVWSFTIALSFELSNVSIVTAPGEVDQGGTVEGSGTITGTGSGTVEYKWKVIMPGGLVWKSVKLSTVMTDGSAGIPSYNGFPTSDLGEHKVLVRIISPNGPDDSLSNREFYTVIPDTIVGTKRAVVLVHGWCGWPDTFGKMKELLKGKGVDVRVFGYNGDGVGDVDNKREELTKFIRRDLRSLAARLGEFIDLEYGKSGNKKVDVVAGSMGGLLVRAWMAGLTDEIPDNVPYDNQIRRLVLAATPNFGTGFTLGSELKEFAEFAKLEEKCHEENRQVKKAQLSQFFYGSEFIKELNERWNKRVRKGIIKPGKIMLVIGCGFDDPFGLCESDGAVRAANAALQVESPVDYVVRYVNRRHRKVARIGDEEHETFQLITWFFGIEETKPTLPPTPQPTHGMIIVRLIEKGSLSKAPFSEAKVDKVEGYAGLRDFNKSPKKNSGDPTGWWTVFVGGFERDIEKIKWNIKVKLKRQRKYAVNNSDWLDDQVRVARGRPTITNRLPVEVLKLLPDLAIPGFGHEAPEPIAPKEKFDVGVAVQNYGQKTAFYSTTFFYLSPDKTRGSADICLKVKIDGIKS